MTPEQLRDEIDSLLKTAGVKNNRKLVRRMLETAVNLGTDDIQRLDLKITSAALAEMRDAFNIFHPHLHVPKVTVFGSARTQEHDPLYELAKDVAERLAAHQWMVVTGAGPGIMQAAAEGAGNDYSIGVSIRLPFEEAPNAQVQENPKLATMKYFFTRKLMLMKESLGFVCLPGGFGTMDEVFELFTLQQTGKSVPTPIVLLDRPGGNFWSGLKKYIDEELVTLGTISEDDMDRALITDSAEAAVDEILAFWKNYHSLRWVDKQLIFRLRHEPTDAEIAQLNEEFSHLLETGEFARTEPFPEEEHNREHLDLARIVFTPKPRAVGSLHYIIRAVNRFETATAVTS